MPGHASCSVVLAATLLMGITLPGDATVCTVPSPDHPTIRSAVDDTHCTEISIAAGSFAESVRVERDVTMRGGGSGRTVVYGVLEVSAGRVILEGVGLEAPAEPLQVHSRAELSGFDVAAVIGDGIPPLFRDGFESGDLSGWSGSAP